VHGLDSVFLDPGSGASNTRPAQPIRPVRPWPTGFSDLTKRFSFKKRARKMLIDIAKPEMSGFYCTSLIFLQLKINSTTIHRYWIRERRRTLRSRCDLCCNMECRCGPELDQLHHFSSITIIITITLSNLSITLQLQLFCAKNIKLQLLLHLLITS